VDLTRRRSTRRAKAIFAQFEEAREPSEFEDPARYLPSPPMNPDKPADAIPQRRGRPREVRAPNYDKNYRAAHVRSDEDARSSSAAKSTRRSGPRSRGRTARETAFAASFSTSRRNATSQRTSTLFSSESPRPVLCPDRKNEALDGTEKVVGRLQTASFARPSSRRRRRKTQEGTNRRRKRPRRNREGRERRSSPLPLSSPPQGPWNIAEPPREHPTS